MKVGYKRVSSLIQNTSRQLVGIKVEKVFQDKVSGKNIEDRIELKQMIEFVRQGDEVYVHSMDRLGRNLNDLLSIVNQLTTKKVSVHFVKENITFSSSHENDSINNLLLGIMGSIAQFERELILERQREGIAQAKLKGVYKGRKPVSATRLKTVEDLILNQNLTVSKACKEVGISVSTFYKRSQVHRTTTVSPR